MALTTVRVPVKDDTDIIKFMIDLNNIVRSEEQRIENADREYLEANVLAFKELGTIGSPAAEQRIAEIMGKKLAKKTIQNIRGSLIAKSWMKKVNQRRYDLITGLKFIKGFPKSLDINLVIEKRDDVAG